METTTVWKNNESKVLTALANEWRARGMRYKDISIKVKNFRDTMVKFFKDLWAWVVEMWVRLKGKVSSIVDAVKNRAQVMKMNMEMLKALDEALSAN